MVAVTSKNPQPRHIWHGGACRLKCAELPRKRPFPAISHVHQASRVEALKSYQVFESEGFEAGYVNLEIDTMHFSNATGDLSALVEEKAKAVMKNITLLSVCSCRIGLLLLFLRRQGFLSTLMEYKKLKEIVVTVFATREYMDTLAMGTGDIFSPGPGGEYTPIEIDRYDDARESMWGLMREVIQFKKCLACDEDKTFIPPAMNVVVVVDGEVMWKHDVGNEQLPSSSPYYYDIPELVLGTALEDGPPI